MKKRRPRNKIDPKQFVEAYLASNYNYEVAEKLGLPDSAIASYACTLRRKGVKLPPRTNRRLTTDSVAELNEIIKAVAAANKKQTD